MATELPDGDEGRAGESRTHGALVDAIAAPVERVRVTGRVDHASVPFELAGHRPPVHSPRAALERVQSGEGDVALNRVRAIVEAESGPRVRSIKPGVCTTGIVDFPVLVD